MTICVDIADRLYDYTDEEKAASAIADYQLQTGMDDDAILTLWSADTDPRRTELEKRIFDAVDANGTAKRARQSVPGGISLYAETEAAEL